jgi:hypothetical protein
MESHLEFMPGKWFANKSRMREGQSEGAVLEDLTDCLVGIHLGHAVFMHHTHPAFNAMKRFVKLEKDQQRR